MDLYGIGFSQNFDALGTELYARRMADRLQQP